MPDCQMCWNDWPSLTGTPFPRIPEAVQVCRNCARSMKQVVAFNRHHGFDLLTGEIVGPQVGSQTPGLRDVVSAAGEGEEEPPSPPATTRASHNASRAANALGVARATSSAILLAGATITEPPAQPPTCASGEQPG